MGCGNESAARDFSMSGGADVEFQIGLGMQAGGDGAGECLWIVWRKHGSAVLHVDDDSAVQIGDVSTEVAELPAPVAAGEGVKAAIATGAKAVAQRERFDFDGAHFGEWKHGVPPQAFDENAILGQNVTANDERQRTEWNEQHCSDDQRARGQCRQAEKLRRLPTECKHDGNSKRHQRRENGDDEQGAAPGGFEVVMSHVDFRLELEFQALVR